MTNSTLTPKQSQPDNRKYLIRCRHDAYEMLNCCPHAQTLTAYSGFLNETVYIPLSCKQWSCRKCAETKIRRMAARTREAKPNRMLTLTIDPQLWESPREAYDGTRRQVSPLISLLRQRYGEVEYLRVTELTHAGWPHYHMLLRSPYLPWSVIQSEWQRLTGASIVDIRPVKKTMNAYTYLVKYLSKIHSIPWTDRHISYSRNFFPPEDKTKKLELDLREVSVINKHPINVVMSVEIGSVWRQPFPQVFVLESENPDFDAQPVEQIDACDPFDWPIDAVLDS